MSDWSTIASMATAGGTLILAVATYASVQSAKRSAQASERSLMAAIRPVLVNSRLRDPAEKVGFVDQHWVEVDGGRAVAEATVDTIYLAMALRNVGPGLAVLDRWNIAVDRPEATDGSPTLDGFRRLTRDIYVPAGDLGFWQGAIRDTADPMFAVTKRAIDDGLPIYIDVLYADHEGGQHTISRFSLLPVAEGQRLCTVSRHWNLDRDDPR